jgi:putative restriction endonuclease
VNDLPEWEGPYYKLLSKNDSGEASGHQSGVVIPKSFDPYMPDLSQYSGIAPSVSISATLVFNGNVVGRVQTRYQYQTWGGDRPPERRITGNLSPLLANSRENDLFLIERNVENDTVFRLSLITSSENTYAQLISTFSGKRWGLLQSASPFVARAEIEMQAKEIEAAATGPFVPFEADAKKSIVTRIARSRAFQKEIARLYPVCAMCGSALRSPKGASELEAAHIISRSSSGTDDPRNGIGLCRAHHWAFDVGLLGITDAGTVMVTHLNILPSNTSLVALHERHLIPPSKTQFRPHIEATRWHLKNVFLN